MESRDILLLAIVGMLGIVVFMGLQSGYINNLVVLRSGVNDLTGNWDVGAFNITNLHFATFDGSYISVDGSNNLIFYDGVTGLKTLSQLAAAGVGGEDGINFVWRNGSNPLTGNWATGGFDITGIGALTSTSLDTGEGANELFDMDQNVLVASDVEFAKLSITSSGRLYIGDQYMYDSGDALMFEASGFDDFNFSASSLEILFTDRAETWPEGRFGLVNSLDELQWTGGVTAGGYQTIWSLERIEDGGEVVFYGSDGVAVATLNTGQGANELYDMDQNVLTTSNPIFADLNITSDGRINFRDNTIYISSESDGSLQIYADSYLYLDAGGQFIVMEQDLKIQTGYGIYLDSGANTEIWGAATGLIDIIGETVDFGVFNCTFSAGDLYDIDDINATSFTIGANTLTTTEWAFLDGIDQALKTTDAVIFDSLDTGYGANELWDMDQHVLIASSVEFAQLTLTGAGKTIYRDAQIYIASLNDGYMDLEADTQLRLNAPVQITGDLTFDGADTRNVGGTSSEIANIYLGTTGKLYFGLDQSGNIEFHGAGTIKLMTNFFLTTTQLDSYPVIRARGGITTVGAGTVDIGSDSAYFRDINYKTLDDRGCPAWISGEETLEMIMKIKPHPTEVSIHKIDGIPLPRFDVETLPDWLRNIPTAESYIRAEKEYNELYKLWEERKALGIVEDPPEPVVPVEGLRFDLLVYNMLTATQEQQYQIIALQGQVMTLEQRITYLEVLLGLKEEGK